jgi:TonB family protein
MTKAITSITLSILSCAATFCLVGGLSFAEEAASSDPGLPPVKEAAAKSTSEGASELHPVAQSSASQLAARNATDKYKAQLEKKIIKQWAPPVYPEKRSALIRFELARKGELINMEILQTSGVPAIDESIQHALLKAAPFKPFPKALDMDLAAFEFTFDYEPKTPR